MLVNVLETSILRADKGDAAAANGGSETDTTETKCSSKPHKLFKKGSKVNFSIPRDIGSLFEKSKCM